MSHQTARGPPLLTEDSKVYKPHVCCRHVQTLVLDLDDLLIHSDWTRGRGWRTFKRPGASDLIKQMATCYELVLYTSQVPIPSLSHCPTACTTWAVGCLAKYLPLSA